MAKKTYPASVWGVVREIYESTPKGFSIEKIRQRAMAFLGEENTPCREAISHKANSNNWEKEAEKQVNLDSDELKKRIDELLHQAEDFKQVSNHYGSKLIELERLNNKFDLYQENLFLKRKTAEVLLEHRKRSYKAGLALDKITEILGDELNKIVDFNDYYENNKDEFEGLEKIEAYQMVTDRFSKVSNTVYAVEVISKATTALAKLDFALYGINPEDTREAETGKRVTSLMSDEDYFKKQQALLIEEGEKIAQRMQLIQSGQFEEDVKQEMLKVASNDDDGFDDLC